MTRRTPLIAGGFLAGAVLGALPPIQDEAMRFRCNTSGGQWRAALHACEFSGAQKTRVQPGTVHELPDLQLREQDR